MRVALIYSRQPKNSYATGNTNENAVMYHFVKKLAAALSSRGVDVVWNPDNTDQNGDRANDFSDNVKWVNSIKGIDLLISNHSNAMGNACILAGPSSASQNWRKKFQAVLNPAGLLPYGDKYENNSRIVSEMKHTYPPAILIEHGQHDKKDYAQWLIDNIVKTSHYPDKFADVIAPILGGRKLAQEVATPTIPVTYVRHPSGDIYALQGRSAHWVAPAEWAKLNPKPKYKQL